MDLSQIVPNIVKIWQQYWQVFLLEGVMNTLKLTAIAVLFGVILGTLVAMAKMCRFKVVRFIIGVYIEVIRGTPILLQLYIFYFVLPQLLPFLALSPFMWVALALFTQALEPS